MKTLSEKIQLSDYEKKAKKNGFTHVDVTANKEDKMLEITRSPHGGMYYFINSHSTGRKEITRSEAADYLK